MRFLTLYGALATLMLTACTGPTVSHQNLGSSDTLATTADARLVYARQIKIWNDGQVNPDHVVCAEPSPDVAKAIATALSAAIEAEAKGATGALADPSVGAGVSHTRSESVAQLGKRLGTIQLLRDGLFSACEAYANGALTRTSYAFLLSRFGDVMVTMLAIEMVAGNAPELAVAEAKSGATSASADKTEAKTEAGTGKTDAGANNVTTSAKPEDAKVPGGTVKVSATSPLTDKQINTIATLQKEFLLGSDSGPLVITCSSVMERSAQSQVPAKLVEVCGEFLGKYASAKVDLLHARRMQALREEQLLSGMIGGATPTPTRVVDNRAKARP